jgi:hypothetical protein
MPCQQYLNLQSSHVTQSRLCISGRYEATTPKLDLAIIFYDADGKERTQSKAGLRIIFCLYLPPPLIIRPKIYRGNHPQQGSKTQLQNVLLGAVGPRYRVAASGGSKYWLQFTLISIFHVCFPHWEIARYLLHHFKNHEAISTHDGIGCPSLPHPTAYQKTRVSIVSGGGG